MPLEALTVIIRALLYIDLLVMFGLVAFALYGLESAEQAIGALSLRAGIAVLALGGLAISILQIVAMASAMAGTPLLPVNIDAVQTLVTKTSIGKAWQMRMFALIALLPTILLLQSRALVALILMSVGAAVAVGSLAWAGHGAMNSGATGWVHLCADVLHLLAAAGWVGAVLALCMLLFDPRAAIDRERIASLDRALSEFASMGTVFVAVILVTGLVNVWVIVGWTQLSTLPGSDYGRLLLAKVVLFLVMLCLATANRFRLSPALGRARLQGNVETALRALQISLLLEIGCALTILIIAAWLGTLAPTK